MIIKGEYALCIGGGWLRESKIGNDGFRIMIWELEIQNQGFMIHDSIGGKMDCCML